MIKKNKNNNILYLIIIVIIFLFLFYIINIFLSKKKLFYKEKFDNNEYILPKVVYGYWDNLEGNDIIKAHINTWYRNIPKGWKIEIISKKTVHKYVENDFLEKYKDINTVRFSDFLRLYLLSKYGGVWMDASTILIDGNFLENYRNEMIEKKIDILLYEFKSHSIENQPYLENWFFISPKGSIFMTDLYNEFTKAYDMGFLEYKYQVLAPKINFDNIMIPKKSTYHMQHGIIIYLLKENPQKYNMSIKDAEESMFKAQKITNWDSEKLIKYIINNHNWNDYYAIKLVGFNRQPIESCKNEFINKLNNI